MMILTTKLFAPPASSRLVERGRLLDKLKGGLERPVTLVSDFVGGSCLRLGAALYTIFWPVRHPSTGTGCGPDVGHSFARMVYRPAARVKCIYVGKG